tara:strand:+ start:692 stop:934 length:243 start_codon:yes stop_codon:yes gene_type:complete
MEIDVLTHTLLAMVCMGGCYYWGYISKQDALKKSVNDAYSNTLDYLVLKGYVKFSFDDKGELQLYKISERPPRRNKKKVS